MENQEKLKPEIQDNSQEVDQFHFEGSQLLHDHMLPLVEKMKDKIDAGAYDILVSDEVGGRAVTLIIRKIYQGRNPDRKFDTYFVPSMSDISEDGSVAKLIEGKYILFITQYIHSGGTVADFIQKIKSLELQNNVDTKIDVATSSILDGLDDYSMTHLKSKDMSEMTGELYFGVETNDEPRYYGLFDREKRLGVIRKIGKAPEPDCLIRIDDKVNYGDNTQFIQMREDIDRIAQNILVQVWGNKS